MWLDKYFDLAAASITASRSWALGLIGSSSRIANGVRSNSSRFHSSSRRSLRLLALAVRASTKLGPTKPECGAMESSKPVARRKSNKTGKFDCR